MIKIDEGVPIAKLGKISVRAYSNGYEWGAHNKFVIPYRVLLEVEVLARKGDSFCLGARDAVEGKDRQWT